MAKEVKVFIILFKLSNMRVNYSFKGKPVILWKGNVYNIDGELMGQLYKDEAGNNLISGLGNDTIRYEEKGIDVWFGIPTPKAQAEMEEYLKTHKLDNYFPAYSARLHNNHFVLMEVAEEVKKRGFDCYCVKDRYECQTTEGVYAIRGNECVLFGFKEVPYQWYVYSDYPGLTSGLIKVNSYDYPFSIEDILSQVGPNRFKENYFSSNYWMKL